VEHMPIMEGKRMSVMLSPKKSTPAPKKENKEKKEE